MIQKWRQKMARNGSSLSVGLDPDLEKLPERFKQMKQPQYEFCKWIVEETREVTVAYKPQLAYFEARGSEGWEELEQVMAYLHDRCPGHFLIGDAKRGDIGSTNSAYVTALYDHLGFDAVTLHPYLGKEALVPFLEREDKVSIILCRTSNPGAGEVQDVEVKGMRLWEYVARQVSEVWNRRNNCMLVVGATYPEELKRVREIVGDMTILVPGIGAQGGNVEAVMNAGLTEDKTGLIIHASRSVIFAESPGEEARKLRDEINEFRRIFNTNE